MPLQISKQVFEAAIASEVPQTRSRILQRHTVMHKPSIRHHKQCSQAETASVAPEIHKDHFSNSFVHWCWVLCNLGWFRWMDWWMVGEWPPCPNKAATSTKSWQSHVLIRNHGKRSVRPLEDPWRGENDLCKGCGVSDWPLLFCGIKRGSVLSKTKSYSILAAMGIKEDKLIMWSHPLLTSTLLRTFGESSSKLKNLWGREAVHIQTATLRGYIDILQINSSRNPAQTHKFSRCYRFSFLQTITWFKTLLCIKIWNIA